MLARRSDIQRHPSRSVIVARAALPATLGAPPAPLEAVLKAERTRRSKTPPAPLPAEFNYAAIAAQSNEVRAGNSIHKMLIAARFSTSVRMDADILERALTAYPEVARVTRVARGPTLPLKQGFRPSHQPGFQRNYQRNRDLVNAKIAADAACGRCLILDADAAECIFRVEFVHVSPSGVAVKRSTGKARATHNLSNGRARGSKRGSLNDMLDLARAALLYGTQKTDGTEILAGNICFAADNADGAPVYIFAADFASAFKLVHMATSASLLCCTNIEDKRCPTGKTPPLLAISSVGTFGSAVLPHIFDSPARAVAWIACTQALDWYKVGFDQFVARPAPASLGTPEDIARFVDDAVGCACGNARCTWFMASYLRAAELVFSPHASVFSLGASSPPVPPVPPSGTEHWPDPPLAYNRRVVASDKLFLPALSQQYTGWTFHTPSELVFLGDNGWVRLAVLLFIDVPHGIPKVRRDVLESLAPTLGYYARVSPILGCVTNELWRLLAQYKAHELVPLTALAHAHLDTWRAILRLAFDKPQIMSFDMRRISCALIASAWIVADASYTGAGAYNDGQFAMQISWSPAEYRGLCAHCASGHDQNVAEAAAMVLSLAHSGERCRGQVLAFFGDNRAALAWLRSNRTTNQTAIGLVRLLAILLFYYQITMEGTPVDGDDNDISDSLSRWHDPSKRTLFAHLTAQSPLPISPCPPFVRRAVQLILCGRKEHEWLPDVLAQTAAE